MPQPESESSTVAAPGGAQPTGRAQIVRAATVVVVAFIASRLLGVLRDVVITYYFGIATIEAEAYAIAIRFPDTIFYIIAGGALGSAFIPTFSAYFVRGDEAGGWRLFSAIVNLVSVVTAAVAGFTALFAPQIIGLAVPDMVAGNPELLDLSVRLTRVMLISPLIFGISGVIMGALNARQHFLLPAIAPILYNLGIILGVVLWAPDAMGLALGTVAGAAGHLAIQLPGLRRQRATYKPILTLRDAGVRQVLRLMGPRVLGLSFSQLNHLVTLLLAQGMIEGSVVALDRAWKLMIMPHGILGQALGIAAFPTLATLAAQSAFGEMRRILVETMRLIYFLGLPAAILMIGLRRPLVALLFERGECGPECVDFISWALLFYTVGLISLTALEVVARAFYALGDTRTPVLAGFLQLMGMLVLGWWLSYGLFAQVGWLPLGGVALGASLANVLEIAILLWLLDGRLRRHDQGEPSGARYWLAGTGRITAAGVLLAAALWAILHVASGAGVWLELILPATLGGAVYLGAAWLLGVAEMQQLFHQWRRRVRG
jgi:putative peptidoglycan lipid II flippase